jgi:hypothetical protein
LHQASSRHPTDIDWRVVRSTSVQTAYLYLDAGEYGLAVAVASEEMPRGDSSETARELASSLLREAVLMGLPDEVIKRRQGDEP